MLLESGMHVHECACVRGGPVFVDVLLQCGEPITFALFIPPASTSALAARMLVPTAVPLRWHTKCSPTARVLA